SAMIDFGYGWNDFEEKYGQREAGHPTLPPFHLVKGTLSAVLDEYCKSRPFQWSYTKDIRAILLEPKNPRIRLIEKHLKSEFPNFNPDLTPDKSHAIVDAKKIAEIWLPQFPDQITVYPDPTYRQEQYHRLALLVSPGDFPKSIYDFVILYLRHSP